jgi:hypothetical protein
VPQNIAPTAVHRIELPQISVQGSEPFDEEDPLPTGQPRERGGIGIGGFIPIRFIAAIVSGVSIAVIISIRFIVSIVNGVPVAAALPIPTTTSSSTGETKKAGECDYDK